MYELHATLRNAKDVQISADEFDRICEQVDNLTVQTRYAARLVLVESWPRQDACKKARATLTALKPALLRIASVRASTHEGWVRVDRWAPPELAEEFEEKVHEAHRALMERKVEG